MFNATEVYDITFQIIAYLAQLFCKRNVYKRSVSNRLKQFVIMAMDCATSSQCKIVAKV